MLDIAMTKEGDIMVSETGDIALTESIRQAVLVRLRWIANEWRLGPGFGFPWFEEVFVKNPNTPKIKQLIRAEIMKVDGVLDAHVSSVIFDKQGRRISLSYTCTVSEETFTEEVALNV